MAKHTYSWRVEADDNFHAIYGLLLKSGEQWDAEHVRRRLIVPLFLGQLIGFYDEDEKLSGFLTYALMNDFCAAHQHNFGVLPRDWRSGPQLWLVDLVSSNGDAPGMLTSIRKDVRDAIAQPLVFFRLKYKSIREVRL